MSDDACSLELDRRTGALSLDRYERLPYEGQELIRGWLRRGLSVDERADEWRFESFVFLWIAFNAWGACVTDEDRDDRMVGSLARDSDLNERFSALVSQEDSPVRLAAIRFQEFWPIFKVQELRELNVHHWHQPDRRREEVVFEYIQAGAEKYEPRCWAQHVSDRPLDWAHVIKALYRVRCNLFHGEKARSSEEDGAIVFAAHGTLAAFLGEAHLIE